MDDPIDKLAHLFAQFPGIGERQSKRFVYFLLTRNNDYLQSLSRQIADLKRFVSECAACHRIFPATGHDRCEYCADPGRSGEELLVVEKDADLDSIRRSRTYNGQYFVLGGSVPIVEKNTPLMIRADALKKRVESLGGLKEVILAFSLTPQGEHTDSYVREMLSPLAEKHGFSIASLGRGLSTGTELEYSDADTIRNALKNRA